MAIFGLGKKKSKKSVEANLPTISDAVVHDSRAGVQQAQSSVNQELNNPLQPQQPVQNSMQSMQNPLEAGEAGDSIPSQDEDSFEEQFNSLLDDSNDANAANKPHPLDNAGEQVESAQQPPQAQQQPVQQDVAMQSDAENSEEKKPKDGFFSEFGEELPEVTEAPKNKNVDVNLKGDVNLENANYAPKAPQPDYSDLKQEQVQQQVAPSLAAHKPKVRKPKFIKRIINGKPELFTEINDLKTVYESFEILDRTNASVMQSLKALDRMHDVEESTIEHFKNYFEELQQDLKTIDHLLFEDFEGENNG